MSPLAVAADCVICGATADHSTPTCCTSHGKVLCHACYRRTHFVAVCDCALCPPVRTTAPGETP